MNHVALAAFGAACLALAWVVRRVQGATQDGFEPALAQTKVPGVLIVPLMFLWPGTALSGARLLFFPSVTGGWMWLGALVMLCGPAGLGLIYWKVLRRVPELAEEVVDTRLYPDPAMAEAPAMLAGWKRVFYRFAFGDNIWVSKGAGYFADKYGMMFDSFKAGCTWVLLLQIGVNLALAFLSAWKPPGGTTCTVRNAIISTIFVAYFFVVAWTRPFNANLDNAVEILVAAMTATALVAMTVGIAFELPPGSASNSVAALCLYHSAVLVIAKGVWDVMVYIADVWMERRSAARRSARMNAIAGVERGFQFEQLVTPVEKSLAHPPRVEVSSMSTRGPYINVEAAEDHIAPPAFGTHATLNSTQLLIPAREPSTTLSVGSGSDVARGARRVAGTEDDSIAEQRTGSGRRRLITAVPTAGGPVPESPFRSHSRQLSRSQVLYM
eukprot:TRINITY_DN9470_c1_g2_i4.p1 TRINITY_DN9470_c1_g2~~TRINITY_DN9470_c1_g2_i4.p1  ORF type:complete len:440 (+),score=127.00 TRINITY_DN9470_c1_g2_i4:1579-2898(+)